MESKNNLKKKTRLPLVDYFVILRFNKTPIHSVGSFIKYLLQKNKLSLTKIFRFSKAFSKGKKTDLVLVRSNSMEAEQWIAKE